MSPETNPDDSRPADVRAAAREKARQLRDTHQRKERRRRALIGGGITVGVLAVLAIVVCSFSGNRDAATFTAPEEFDITAERETSRVLTFGAGIHYCVGANLARAEIAEALAFLARRIERLEPDGEPDLQNVSGIYGVNALPVRFAATVAA